MQINCIVVETDDKDTVTAHFTEDSEYGQLIVKDCHDLPRLSLQMNKEQFRDMFKKVEPKLYDETYLQLEQKFLALKIKNDKFMEENY